MTESLLAASLVVTGPEGERTVSLVAGNTWSIGRTGQSDVALFDNMVSRNHAIVQRVESGEYYLIDMGSRNGSFVNGSRVTVPQALKDGDSIAIGKHGLTFRYVGTDPGSRLETLGNTGTQISFASSLVSVLVVDVRDFTGLTQQLSQTVLCEMISAWFGHGGRILREHGSWSQKYIGDSLMAIWLHQPGRERQQILEILSAYVEIAAATSGLQSQFSLPTPLLIGGGMNTGIASVGNAGTSHVVDFTAIGDSVNTAFRIQVSTKQIGMDLAIGESTYDYLQPLSDYFQPHTVDLKGYDRPASIWGIQLDTLKRFLATKHL